MGADQGTVTMKTPVKAAPRVAAPAPAHAVGEDTVAVLEWIGLAPAEIEQLERQGAIGTAATRDE
jgi:crotonobetainyl-CoA:carnitine CoA-transferase CaiB-like acyl-CoA transferase